MHLFVCLFMIAFCVADDKIIKLSEDCPPTTAGSPLFRLRADVSVYAEADCMNGRKLFKPDKDGSEHQLLGSFDLDYNGPNCVAYQKAGSNTFTVEVKYGWGEKGAEIITYTAAQTLSCVYDEYGNALSGVEKVNDAIMAAEEVQTLVGPVNTTVKLDLHVMDVLDESISFASIEIGRKIRLYARDLSKAKTGFQPVSCEAHNDVSRYVILVAGCGDGLVISRKLGFVTAGHEMYSPYFRAFRLNGSPEMKFTCNFTICEGKCDGDSCSLDTRKPRSLTVNSRPQRNVNSTCIKATTKKISTKDQPFEDPDKEWGHLSTVPGHTNRLQPDQYAHKDDALLSLPMVAGIIMVLMCLVATILAVYFVLSTPRSSTLSIGSDPNMVINELN